MGTKLSEGHVVLSTAEEEEKGARMGQGRGADCG